MQGPLVPGRPPRCQRGSRSLLLKHSPITPRPFSRPGNLGAGQPLARFPRATENGVVEKNKVRQDQSSRPRIQRHLCTYSVAHPVFLYIYSVYTWISVQTYIHAYIQVDSVRHGIAPDTPFADVSLARPQSVSPCRVDNWTAEKKQRQDPRGE
ncbi:hypothetical protein VTG60DRAFT_1051 [Thermothelomyces hinnuleus]